MSTAKLETNVNDNVKMVFAVEVGQFNKLLTALAYASARSAELNVMLKDLAEGAPYKTISADEIDTIVRDMIDSSMMVSNETKV